MEIFIWYNNCIILQKLKNKYIKIELVSVSSSLNKKHTFITNLHTMKVDFKELKVTTLDGQKVAEVYKAIANTIYMNAKNLDLVDFALKINKWEEIEITKKELEEIKEICLDEKSSFFAFVKKAISNFIDNLK